MIKMFLGTPGDFKKNWNRTTIAGCCIAGIAPITVLGFQFIGGMPYGDFPFFGQMGVAAIAYIGGGVALVGGYKSMWQPMLADRRQEKVDRAAARKLDEPLAMAMEYALTDQPAKALALCDAKIEDAREERKIVGKLIVARRGWDNWERNQARLVRKAK